MTELEGILCVDKPPDHTSFDVVARMRGIAKTRKIGHGGTLDPMATGVLPLFFGRAAKACDLLPDQRKRYTAAFRLGLSTDTQDITGTVLERRPVSATAEDIRALLPAFTGPQEQVPPMYSAVKIGGKRLYDLARQGLEVERPPRPITVHSLRLLEADQTTHTYTVDVLCSKGAYIRTLCHDMGRALGCGAVLTALRRTESCGYALEACVTLEETAALAEQGTLHTRLLPVETAFSTLPALRLSGKLAAHFCNGVPLSLNQLAPLLPGPCAVYREDGLFLGLARPDHAQNQLRLQKLFHLPKK